MGAPLPVIVNSASGRGHDAAGLETLRGLFRDAGAEARVLVADDGEELRAIARREAGARPPVIVAGGGDGTINAVASELIGTDIALGIVPLGTLNHFARDAGIPLDPSEAARNVVASHSVRMDVGQVNDRIFINNSSIGLYPRMVRHREMQQHRLGRGKWHAMFWAVMAVLRHSPFLRVKLRLDAEDRHCVAPFIFIGNNEYVMEGFAIGQRRRLDAGQLTVYFTSRPHRAGVLRLFLRALFGRLRQSGDFEARAAHSVQIASRHRHLLVATDGEIASMETPLDYRSLAGALRVIVPAPVAP